MMIVDCDVHATVPSIDVLVPRLEPHWREVAVATQFRGPTDTAYPAGAATSLRPDLVALDPPAGSTLADVRTHVLDGGVDRAIVTCTYALDAVKNPDAASALARAVNDWIAEDWLAHEPRLRGSIVVPALQPGLAADEVERVVAAHDGFVQVLVPVRSFVPLGNRMWWPLLEAVARHDLVLGLHFGGSAGNPPTSVGWPTTYLEEYVDAASAFQAQLMSLVCEGAFDRIPALRVACIEGGFAWVPSMLWRMDRLWRSLRREIPWVARAPSGYVRDHIRFTTRPFDAPTTRAAFDRLLAQIGSAELLMYASDYPHWHGDDDERPLLDDGALAAVLGGNARAFYRLDRDV